MDPYLTLSEAIGGLARRWHRAADHAVSGLGLNHTEARILTLLDRHGGEASQDALSEQISVDRSNAGRALQHLEQAGYVERRKDATNRRANLVRITERGRTTAADIARIRGNMAQRFFGHIDEREAARIAELLGKASADDLHA